MKRKIEDYINQKVAIECETKEQWQKIIDFSKIELINKFDLSSNKCINLNTIAGGYWGRSSKEDIIKQGYTIYPASDFLEEESKFEERKWYKRNTISNSKGYLMYVKSLEINIKDNTQVYKERINGDGEYINLEKNSSCTFKNFTLLTDLLEIQEFLPPNHPDLIIKEIIPEYVECIKGDSTEDFNHLGKIYKVEYYNPYTGGIKILGEQINSIFFGEKSLIPKNNTDYKPSTKEAYEAQNKSKQLTGYNLLPNEIYVTDDPTDYIFKTSETSKGYSHYICKFKCFYSILNKDYIWRGNLRLATKEEEKWLNTCISQDKFIPKEDLHLYDDSGLLVWEIGCYYKLNFTDNTSTYIKLSKKVDDRIYGNEYTDSTGKWYYSEIIWSTKQLKSYEKVDKPNQKEEPMFKKDNYIICLNNVKGKEGVANFCYKLIKDQDNINSPLFFEKHRAISIPEHQIRYATSKEIAKYSELGRPFDVTTLVKTNEKMKSLLEEAKERYPIGTKFKSVVTRNLFTVKSHVNEAKNSNIVFHTIESNSSGNHWGCVYENGTWAEIISLPNEIPITSDCIMYNGENISKGFEVSSYYEFDGKSFNQDIYIPSITKKSKKLQTITIESTTDLNLGLTKIKSKQIQTIKI